MGSPPHVQRGRAVLRSEPGSPTGAGPGAAGQPATVWRGNLMKRSPMGRRSALAAPLAVVAVGALAFGTAAAAPSAAPVVSAPSVASATTALPSVDMARVLAAAQVEPR